MKLLPSLLYPDFEQFSARFHECIALDGEVHIDFADGDFVANRLPSIDKVVTLPGEIKLEAHFMVQRPAGWVESALKDNRFQTLIIHAEADVDIPVIVGQVKQAGRRIGLALKSTTTIEQVAPYLPMVDQVLVLLVDPGYNGSPFLPEMVDKIQQLRVQYPQLVIEADGGMNPETVPLAVRAGATKVSVGSYLAEGDLSMKLQELQVPTVQRKP